MSTSIRTVLLAAAVLIGGSRPVSAQLSSEPAYRLAIGDTVRYIEFARARRMTTLPQGELPSTLERNALMVMTADSAGFWRAWYGDLEVRAIRIGGVVSPDVEFLMGRPFRLEVSDRGDVDLLEVPTLRSEFAALFDATTQFTDFFVRLPEARADDPPAPGTEWSDTVTTSDLSTMTDLRTVRRMRVRGDTLVDGVPATVIEVTTETTMASRMAVPGWDAPASARFEGTDTGVMIFDFADGRMLLRTREGELGGSLVTSGVEASEVVRYSSTISLAR